MPISRLDSSYLISQAPHKISETQPQSNRFTRPFLKRSSSVNLYEMGIEYEKLNSIFTTELHQEFPEPEQSVHNIPTFGKVYKTALRFPSARSNDSLYYPKICLNNYFSRMALSFNMMRTIMSLFSETPIS